MPPSATAAAHDTSAKMTGAVHRRRPGATETETSRAAVYECLATALTSPPTAGIIQAVRDMAAVLGLPFPDGCDLLELNQEFTALFVVPGPRYVAPYESVYRGAWQLRASPGYRITAGDGRSQIVKGLLMGDSTLAVEGCYREAGVSVGTAIPDHIGHELRFVAYLCHRRATDPVEHERLADLQARFRDEHLLKWLHLLRQRIGESERLGFYTLVVRLAEEVLSHDT